MYVYPVGTGLDKECFQLDLQLYNPSMNNYIPSLSLALFHPNSKGTSYSLTKVSPEDQERPLKLIGRRSRNEDTTD